ncbi:site-specific integrase [Nonomuraea sp. NPDC050202]|uniref:site-specific integrase n=1 Tax=Nonomuraea sp. NPDC050202 TaxID=3155035 RepID=UPI0033D61859
MFRDAWPKIANWFAAPLVERVGRLPEETQKTASYPVSFNARPYLVFLGLRGYLTFDYAWSFGTGQIRVDDAAAGMGLDLGTSKLIEEAVALGYNANSARQAMRWTVGRIALHTGIHHASEITDGHIAEALEAIRLFSERDDLHHFYPSAQNFLGNAAKQWITHLHQLQVVLFHRGQVATQPRKLMPSWKPPLVLPSRMQAVADKWLAARRLTDAPATVEKLEIAVRRFGEWLAEHDAGIVSFADVTRDHCLGWIESLAEAATEKTGRPLGAVTRIQRISGLSQMFRDTAAWEYDDVPGYAPITARDAPKLPQRIPRFIPDHELDLLMPVINDISCPFQRAALLIARWSGARRDEIRHLPIDCLDHYPDATPRLRLPGRKTYKERVVPLHQDAADALQKVINLRKNGPERPFTDPRTGEQIRYLFMDHGKLLSLHYLFNTPIQQACMAVGLVVPGGKKNGPGVRGTISAHRFRHTVGTQLAERGAKLHTIMKVLGHSSVSMALIYAQISDQEVLRDYKSVLAPGAVIAGPAALDLKSGVLPDDAVHWLKTNFFKTELELGHCLRLPTEGPCECDLYLTCAKFVTTPDYTPRLQARLEVEQQLVQDADERGWTREVERHTAVARRLQALLTDLGETPGHTDPPACHGAWAASNPDRPQIEDDSAGSPS